MEHLYYFGKFDPIRKIYKSIINKRFSYLGKFKRYTKNDDNKKYWKLSA